MIAPIVLQEMQVGSRQGRFAVFRCIYAGWLLVQLLFMAFVHWIECMLFAVKPAEIWAGFGTSYYRLFLGQHFLLLVLATPLLAAGAITDEKVRGTLQYLLTASASPAEIIVGKLLARLFRVLLLLLPGLPLFCFFGVYAGMEPEVVLVFLASTVLVACGVAAVSLLASVWCRQTRDAVIGMCVAAIALGLGSAFVPESKQVLAIFSPLPALTLDSESGRSSTFLKMSLAWLILIGLCVGVAAWRLRPAYCRQLEARRKGRHWWSSRRRPVADEPIRWKEQYLDGIAPLALLRSFPRGLGLLLVGLATLFFSGRILLDSLPPEVTPGDLWRMLLGGDIAGLAAVYAALMPAGTRFYWQEFYVMLIANLVVGIRCAGAVSGEREQQTWEALLVTSLETRALVRGKLWAILAAFFPYLLIHALVALPLALLAGLSAFGWTLMWLGATVVAGAFSGAVGIWCSARSRSSWRSLLGTLGICYVGGFIVTMLAMFLVGIIAIIFVLMWTFLQRGGGAFMGGGRLFENIMVVGICLLVAGVASLLAWRLPISAEKRIDAQERVRQGPWRRRSKERGTWQESRRADRW